MDSGATSLPPDHELAKRLFSSSPERSRQGEYTPSDSPRRREPLQASHGDYKFRSQPRRGSRVGFCGAVIFLSLCLAAVVLTIRFNDDWNSITTEGDLTTSLCYVLVIGIASSVEWIIHLVVSG